EGADLGQGLGEPGARIPVVIVLATEHAVVGPDADVVQPHGHQAGRLVDLPVRVVEGLAAAGRAGRLVDHLGLAAEQRLRRLFGEVLGGGEEVSQLAGLADGLDVDAVTPEPLPVEGRVPGGMAAGSAPLPELDRPHGLRGARGACEAVGRDDRSAVDEARDARPDAPQQQLLPHASRPPSAGERSWPVRVAYRVVGGRVGAVVVTDTCRGCRVELISTNARTGRRRKASPCARWPWVRSTADLRATPNQAALRPPGPRA